MPKSNSQTIVAKVEKVSSGKRRGQNEGSIYKRKDGRWTACLNLGYQNGKLKRKYFYGETRAEVQKALSKPES